MTKGYPTSTLPGCPNPLPPNLLQIWTYIVPSQSHFWDISQHPLCLALPPGRRSPGAAKHHHQCEKRPCSQRSPQHMSHPTPGSRPGPSCATQRKGPTLQGLDLGRERALIFLGLNFQKINTFSLAKGASSTHNAPTMPPHWWHMWLPAAATLPVFPLRCSVWRRLPPSSPPSSCLVPALFAPLTYIWGG